LQLNKHRCFVQSNRPNSNCCITAEAKEQQVWPVSYLHGTHNISAVAAEPPDSKTVQVTARHAGPCTLDKLMMCFHHGCCRNKQAVLLPMVHSPNL
jgi:hypothetical protein